MSELIDLPLRAQAAALTRRETSAKELMQTVLDRISRRDPKLHAVVHLDARAMDEAQRWDDTPLEDRPTLAGLALGVKDILDVAQAPTRCGSYAQDKLAQRDAAAVARLRRAGMTPLAKLATYEYALTGPAWDQPNPPARNPWNTAHITGGSSSGSAAAVAGGLLRVALGTDTGGSIRAPAAYCGIVGLKPTLSSVPDAGCFPLSPALDVIGPLAACVEDAALVMEALVPDSKAARALGQDIEGLRIGYARDWFVADPACDPALLRAMDDAAATLSMLGARIELIDLPDYQPLEEAGSVILQAEAWEVHRAALADHWPRYGVDARRNLVTGAILSEAHVAAARRAAARFGAQVTELLGTYAALLAPTTLGPAPRFADFEDGPVWTAMRTLPFNMSGHPALSVPCALSDAGLPLGLQLIGRHGDEATLCRIGHAYEQAGPNMLCPPITCPGAAV
ncbi:amidase [Salipiger sp. PrR007]|uniref:amidase n=1 Tax=Salipiger sp. PrR007 TaxID=2706884 RepID=UPI0013BBE74E|nr:amidase [Salipiger sp. PrR007]NDW32493.1 amidase [Salipiger sp. PrR007]